MKTPLLVASAILVAGAAQAALVEAPAPDSGAAGETRIAQYIQNFPAAQLCPRQRPSRFSRSAQYTVWQCVRQGKAQYDFYNAAGYSHSMVLPN